MALNEYVSIPNAATAAGAPIDAFLLRTLRENDVFAEKRLRGAMASPFIPNGVMVPGGLANVVINGPLTDEHKLFCYNAKTIELNVDLITMASVPLIWFATEEIHLKANIDASGKGAQRGKKGNFGGAGGGRAGVPGTACELPISEVVVANGGTGVAAVNGGNGANLEERWASRLSMHLAGATGGGPGAGTTGGHGGGIVILCAPKITIDATKHIWAKGDNGAAGAGSDGDGGGGGGLIVLIAHEYINAIPGGNLIATGGTGFTAVLPANKNGGNGGNGLVLKYSYV